MKDIVEECHITRQTFYYHFEGIPEMLRWMLENDLEILMEQCLAQKDEESALRYLLTVAISLQPYVERSVQTAYGKEIEKLLSELIDDFLERSQQEQADMHISAIRKGNSLCAITVVRCSESCMDGRQRIQKT